MIKQRKESSEIYKNSNRDDLEKKENERNYRLFKNICLYKLMKVKLDTIINRGHQYKLIHLKFVIWERLWVIP